MNKISFHLFPFAFLNFSLICTHQLLSPLVSLLYPLVVEFLLACGFTYRPTVIPLLSKSTETPKPEFLELLPPNESTPTLLSARKALATTLLQELHVPSSEIPKMKTPPTKAAPAKRTNAEFDVFKTCSYNTQSAAVGANATTIGDGGLSTTERKLQTLQKKQERLEKKMQVLNERELVAWTPGMPEVVVSNGGSQSSAGESSGGKGDGALLAGRMKRMEEERKKREEGGFTTKAMRDLEKIKKQKVYTHTQLRINFPDGCSLYSKFLPSEKISTVKEVIISAFHENYQKILQYDLYVAPPRRLLDISKRLEEEGLVPAAKVFVSWKMNGAPPSNGDVGSYIRNELFPSSAVSSAAAVAFPGAKKIVEDDSNKSSAKKPSAGGDAKISKEELLMQRMLGKKPKGLFGKSTGSAKGSSSGGGGGKPKWFKG
mmetsp:Transcript_5418/g.7189  ORF Transcript_5418/g.7189 Transcript_5418/m.7189 type:complete len:430 (+) Transcript_5418:97-1386(+)